MCTIHGNNLVPDVCNVCRHCTHFIKAPVVKQLVVASAPTVSAVIPGPADRLLVRRSDERDPTLVFTQEEMAIASKLFTMGTLKKGHFEELTRDHLFLPAGQNETLFENMMLEGFFKKYEHDKRFRHIFVFKDQLVKLGKELRVAQRPFVQALGTATQLSQHVR